MTSENPKTKRINPPVFKEKKCVKYCLDVWLLFLEATTVKTIKENIESNDI